MQRFMITLYGMACLLFIGLLIPANNNAQEELVGSKRDFMQPAFITPEEKKRLKTLQRKSLITSLTNKENRQLERLAAQKKEAKAFQTQTQSTFRTVGFWEKEHQPDQAPITDDIVLPLLEAETTSMLLPEIDRDGENNNEYAQAESTDYEV